MLDNWPLLIIVNIHQSGYESILKKTFIIMLMVGPLKSGGGVNFYTRHLVHRIVNTSLGLVLSVW